MAFCTLVDSMLMVQSAPPSLQVVIMADGQVTRNTEIVKPNVKKVRTMIDGSVIGGFAGKHTSSLQSCLLHLSGHDCGTALKYGNVRFSVVMICLLILALFMSLAKALIFFSIFILCGHPARHATLCILREWNTELLDLYAGATADAFTLFERLESQLEAHPGDRCLPTAACYNTC